MGTVVVIRCSDGAALAQQEADPLPAKVGTSCRDYSGRARPGQAVPGIPVRWLDPWWIPEPRAWNPTVNGDDLPR